MFSVMEAIQRRRSIRKFKDDPVPDELVTQILEAARLAPSGSNRQPWRFQIITDRAQRERIFNEATFGDKHILAAPVMIVCGSELLSFVKGHRLAPPSSGPFGANSEEWDDIKQFIPDANLNTAIAVEHMVLAATALGLGTCWVQRIKYGQVARILGWPRHIVVVTLLLVGYADEEPPPKPRLALDDLVIREGRVPS
ncbi:MAG: nitroreductase family protein [Chloroflexota bacterium]